MLRGYSSLRIIPLVFSFAFVLESSFSQSKYSNDPSVLKDPTGYKVRSGDQISLIFCVYGASFLNGVFCAFSERSIETHPIEASQELVLISRLVRNESDDALLCSWILREMRLLSFLAGHQIHQI